MRGRRGRNVELTTFSFLPRLSSSSPYLAHYTYLRSLPSPSDLLTPLYFTATERELLQGTSVYGAANEMETTWKADFERVGKVLRLSEKHGFTWCVPLHLRVLLRGRN